ncbi:saccharopine dehydrogenase family protein [Anditalea andensis]|uniref:Saccharopine dehydrogenase NADP binding domain-containing protein n=1 Tax=Anditalea andensis TaxID=1048983 RepID=A0A074LK80_9BACT|nr:saccharopine dehydrogenase NADP-binding domain-containing protein [Anditalea andensis]KEO74212.1 hypothetical protein EL17_08745 [Anditalea andensis]
MGILLYGANGYSGNLITEEALRQGIKPVLAGRNESKIISMATAYKLEYKVFGLENVPKIVSQLEGISLVLNCAGPFAKTAKPLIEACLLAQCHYLDITGELDVFEMAKKYDLQAKDNEVIIMPGVGFDVVPTDCMANHLKAKLPEATHLELAFMNLGGGISHGTLTTMVEGLGKNGAVRENGHIEEVLIGHQGKEIDFGIKKSWTMTIPWGDISTAYTSTGIPNIQVFTAIPKTTFNLLKAQQLINPILQNKWVKGLIKDYVDENITGPTPDQNKNGVSLVYGKVTDKTDREVEARLKGPESYAFTAKLAVLLFSKVLETKDKYGYFTPAKLFGANLVLEVEGVTFI